MRIPVVGRVDVGGYHGQPMGRHVNLPVDGSHFDCWLSLFEATADEFYPPGRGGAFHRVHSPYRRQATVNASVPSCR